MSFITIIAACVFIIVLVCPTEKGSILSLILSRTCLPLRSGPLAISALFLLTVGFFLGWYFTISLALAMFLNLMISITVGREVASDA